MIFAANDRAFSSIICNVINSKLKLSAMPLQLVAINETFFNQPHLTPNLKNSINCYPQFFNILQLLTQVKDACSLITSLTLI